LLIEVLSILLEHFVVGIELLRFKDTNEHIDTNCSTTLVVAPVLIYCDTYLLAVIHYVVWLLLHFI